MMRGGDAADAHGRRGARPRADRSRLGRVPRRRGRSGADAARRTSPPSRVAAAPARALRHRVGVDRDDGPRPRTSPHRSSSHRSPTSAWPMRTGRRALPGPRRPPARRSASRPSRPRARPRSLPQRPAALRFLQVYVFRDHGVTDELIAEAIDAGFTAVFLTVDLPVLGPRDRERRIHWTFDDDTLPAVGRALDAGTTGEALDAARPGARLGATWSGSPPRFPVPVVVKGDPRPEDAVLAAEHGAAGIVVSNHGGRQLDGAMPTLEALPADRRRGRRPAGGALRRRHPARHRRGDGARPGRTGRARRQDAALGSRRRGEEGAREVLELLREELAIALHLMGCRSVARALGREPHSAHRPRITAP